MTSVGRGRGWATAQTGTSQLRRPGRPTSPKSPFDVTSLINELNSIEDEKELEKKTNEIVNSLFNARDEDALAEVCIKLYDYALTDRSFIPKLVSLVCTKSKLNCRDMQSMLAKHAQVTYKSKEEVRKESVNKFRNAVYILCEFLGKTQHRTLAARIAEAVLDYMNMLVQSNDEDDIEIIAEKMTQLGSVIFSNSKKEDSAVHLLDNLVEKCRYALVTQELSPKCRAMLLYIIELTHQDWSPLPDNVEQFYISKLGMKPSIIRQPSSIISNVSTPRAIHGTGGGSEG